MRPAPLARRCLDARFVDTATGPQPDRIRIARRHPVLFRLWIAATIAAWVVVFALVLRSINAIDFGPVGLPVTVAIRFAVETVLFTTLAYLAIRSLPLCFKPGLRATSR